MTSWQGLSWFCIIYKKLRQALSEGSGEPCWPPGMSWLQTGGMGWHSLGPEAGGGLCATCSQWGMWGPLSHTPA